MENKDISFLMDNTKYNSRVSAIILSSDAKKILLHTVNGFDFYLLPGGRIKLKETGLEAIKRELNEEINLKNIELKERAFIENIFIFNNTFYHEIQQIFVTKLNSTNIQIQNCEEFVSAENSDLIYKWVNINDIEKYNLKPFCLKNLIINYNSPFEYVIEK